MPRYKALILVPLQETLYIGLQDTRMQAFKLPLTVDAPAGAAANGAAAAPDSLADGALPGDCGATICGGVQDARRRFAFYVYHH